MYTNQSSQNMEDPRHEQTKISTTMITKTEYCLSPKSHLSFHTNNGSSSYCYHEPFQSSESCAHTNASSLTSSQNNFGSTTLNSISISPAVMEIKQRRNSLNLSNSCTPDANDICAESSPRPPALDQLFSITSPRNQPCNPPDKLFSITSPRHQICNPPNNTLSVPVYDIEESADEYDSDAHRQTDEALIIKRVLAKFNLQNKEIIRKNLSFIDSFNFFQGKIDKSKRDKKKRRSELYHGRKISIGHHKLLQDLSRRTTIHNHKSPSAPPVLPSEHITIVCTLFCIFLSCLQ